MNIPNIYLELFGYAGVVMVIISMLMTSVVKLRIFNALGSLISAVYALLIGSYPLVLMNVCLLVINVYNLVRLLKVENHYDLVETKGDDGFVTYFLSRYGQDMRNFFTTFHPENPGAERAYITCCNGLPVGLVLGNPMEDGLDVVVDYTIPSYRDCSVAAFLYPALADKGYENLRFGKASSLSHIVYLDKMGFVKKADAVVKKLK